jgi:peroxiredoxin
MLERKAAMITRRPLLVAILATSAVAAVIAAVVAPLSSSAVAPATIGQPAPAFTATAVDGRRVSLADFRGRTVVLEWVSPRCHFVRKHYDSMNMQRMQMDATANGVVWIAVASSAPSSRKFMPPAALAAWMQQQGATPTATLVDADGRIGRAFGAQVTPHMFIVDARGRLAYVGAVDSIASPHVADVDRATNFVAQALAELAAGRAVSMPLTRPYGCAIPYADG